MVRIIKYEKQDMAHIQRDIGVFVIVVIDQMQMSPRMDVLQCISHFPFILG